MHTIRFRLGEHSFSIDILYLLMSLYCIVILCLPNSVINSTTVFMIETPENITYKYFTYRLTYYFLPILFISLLYRKNTYAIKFWYVIIAIFFKDIIFSVFGKENLFASGNYEMYFILLQAESVCCIALCNGKENIIKKANIFLDLYTFVAFFTLIMGIITNQTILGRYYVLGLGVGSTGYFSAIYLLYNMYVREFDQIMWLRITIAAIMLVLSGQRTCILIFIVFCIPFFYKYLVRQEKVNKQTLIRVVMLVIILFFGGIIFILFLGDADYLTRMFDALLLLVNGKITSEDSVNGRVDSILAGIQILHNNPFGLVNDYYVLQREIGKITFPTFPHSRLISDMLLWSTPIVLYCCIYVYQLWKRLYERQNSMHIIVLFMAVMAIIWGGPELEVSLLFLRLFFLSIAKVLSKIE